MNLERIEAIEAISLSAVIREEDDARMAFSTPGLAVAAVGSPPQIRTKFP